MNGVLALRPAAILRTMGLDPAAIQLVTNAIEVSLFAGWCEEIKFLK
jgi:hypothetical protein